MKKSVKEKALDHYDKMIAWVKTQPKTNRPGFNQMADAIQETYGGDSCPYCKKHKLTCEYCELSAPPIKAGHPCCKGLWEKMTFTRTWGAWLRYAYKIKKYIQENG